MPNYGFDEFLRDVTGIDITGRKPAPATKVVTKPAPVRTPPIAGNPARATPAPTQSRGNSRGERNNNPGNLEDGPFTRSQPGYIGSDGRFAKFDSPASGNRAQVRLLQKNYANMSPAQIIKKYAPAGDNSEASMRNYIGYISARTGIDPDKPVSPDRMVALAAAMREFETGKTQKGTKFSPYGGAIEGGRRMARGNGAGVTPAGNYERWLESNIPPEVAASTGVRLPGNAAQVIADAPEEIQARQQGVDSALGDMGKRIDVLDDVTQAAQAVQVIQRTEQVEDSRRINQEIIGATDELKRKVQPVMEARGRVADQLDKLATMNPLERSLKSIFDLDYDQGFLTKQLERFDRTLQARMYDYQYLDTLQGVALREIDRRYGIETALTDLDVQQSTEDLALVNQRLGLASQMLSSSREELATQSQIIVAQAQAREAVLSRLDTPTVMGLMTQAQANGGLVTHEGVEFSYKELRDTAELAEQQQRAIRSNQLALAQGEMSLAEGIATDLARSMTREQLEQAAANGGVWRGVQLPQDVITAGLASHRQRAEGQAQDILTRMPQHVAQQTAASVLNSINSLYMRSKGLMGKSDLLASSTILRDGSEQVRQLLEATRSGAAPEVIQAMVLKLGETQKTYQKTVSQSILRSTGGDKRAAGYVESFVYGSPMNPGTAAEALTYFALKGGLPDGLAISPEARQVFVKAQQVANANRMQNGKPVGFDRLNQIVQSEVSEYAASIIGTPRLVDTLKSLPSHAKAIGSPLGKMSTDWWRKTYTEAQNYASAELAKKIGTTPGNINIMMDRMRPVDSTPQSKKIFEAFMAQAGQFNAIEQTYLLDKLDSVNPFEPGKANSELFEEFLYSPDLHRRVNQTAQVIEGNSFGDFLVGPLAQGSTQGALVNYAQSTADAVATNRVRTITSAREVARGWGYSPRARIGTILKLIPGVGKAGMEKLMPFVEQAIPQSINIAGAINSASTGYIQTPADTLLHQKMFIEKLRSTKFDDPSAEAYRKATLQNWEEYSGLADSVITNFTESAKQ